MTKLFYNLHQPYIPEHINKVIFPQVVLYTFTMCTLPEAASSFPREPTLCFTKNGEKFPSIPLVTLQLMAEGSTDALI